MCEILPGKTENAPRLSALFPFAVFVVFYVGLSLWSGNFYSVPMPVAFLVASATALLLDRGTPFAVKAERYAHDMGDTNIMLMCMIFILAGMFAATAKAMGAVDSTVLLARHLIPGKFLLAGFFLMSCFISLAVGTSCGTIAALIPIAAGLVKATGIPPVMMFGAVIGGAMFGDNMSMISDTTIAATRTQSVAMRDKFLMNLRIALPAAAVTLALYCFLGETGAAAGPLEPLTGRRILAVAPYFFVLIGALAGINVMALLFLGTVLAAAVGILSGDLPAAAALAEAGKGTLNMSETLIVAILAGGLLGAIRHNGGIEYLLRKVERTVSGTRGGELGIAFLVGAVNLFTANNTVAIVIAGPIARDLSRKYHCDPRRAASILDTASCVVQGIIPYGAQILIALGIARDAGLDVSSLRLVGALWYPFCLGVFLLLEILLTGRRSGRAEA
ncbi:MAG: Na+/H+ antiporter NhaC family protein [Lentisphaeria bacterium]|nr:Na+/H+ antiporter NhaC family protein [Lentisphaeria bacterium]